VLDNFTGTASFLNFQMAKDTGQGACDVIQVTGTNAGGNALFLGGLGMQAPEYYTNSSSGTFSSLMMSRYYDPSTGSVAVADQNLSADTNFFRNVFALSRSKAPPATLSPVPAGATDFQAYKIYIQRTHDSIHLQTNGIPAQVSIVTVPSTNAITVVFSKAMRTNGLTAPSNYSLSGSGEGTMSVHPSSVAIINSTTVQLTWTSGEMFSGGDIVISVSGLLDLGGNAVASTGQALGAGRGTPPQTAITSPADGGRVTANSTITVSATASDSSGIAQVEFLVNGSVAGTMTHSGSKYKYSWTIPSGSGISYVLNSRATDNAGNQALSSNVSVQTR
jgi:hypothetical protein